MMKWRATRGNDLLMNMLRAARKLLMIRGLYSQVLLVPT